MTTTAQRTFLTFIAGLSVSAAQFLHGADLPYREVLLADKPAAYWRFDTIEECCTPNETHESLRANAGTNVSLLEAGPRPPSFPRIFRGEHRCGFHRLRTRHVSAREGSGDAERVRL